MEVSDEGFLYEWIYCVVEKSEVLMFEVVFLDVIICVYEYIG